MICMLLCSTDLQGLTGFLPVLSLMCNNWVVLQISILNISCQSVSHFSCVDSQSLMAQWGKAFYLVSNELNSLRNGKWTYPNELQPLQEGGDFIFKNYLFYLASFRWSFYYHTEELSHDVYKGIFHISTPPSLQMCDWKGELRWDE